MTTPRPWSTALAVLALAVLGALVALISGLAAMIFGVLRQGVGAPRPSAPLAAGPPDAATTARVGVLIGRLPPFAGLGEDATTRLAGAVRIERHAPGAILRVQGRADGALTVIVSGRTVATIAEESGIEHALEPPAPGDAWGEGALVGRAVAATTVRAASEVEIARLDREAFEAVANELGGREAIDAGLRDLACLRGQVAFESLPSARLARLLEASTVARFAAGATVLEATDRTGTLFVLREGACRVTRSGGAALDLGAGDVVGERSLLAGAARDADVVAIEPTVALRLDARAVARVLLEDPRATAALEALAAERQAFVGAR